MKLKKICLLIVLIIAAINCKGQIRLPKLIGNGMILQREDSIKLWGWAAPGEMKFLQSIMCLSD